MALTVKNTFKLAEKYIANTAKILDKEYPGWEKRINCERLDMSSCSDCICGQLRLEANKYDDISFEQGFWWFSDKHQLPNKLSDYASPLRKNVLKDIWIKEIDQRLAV